MAKVKYIGDNPETVIVGTEGMVFETLHDSITGGVILDTEGFNLSEVKEGHLIIVDKTNNEYRPMPVSGAVYDSMPSGFAALGLCSVTTATSEAMFPVGLAGKVNEALLPYTLTEELKTALPHLIFN